MPFDDSKPLVILEFNAVAAKKFKPSLDEIKHQFKLSDNEIDYKRGIGVILGDDGVIYQAVITAEAGKRLEKERARGFLETRPCVNPRLG